MSAHMEQFGSHQMEYLEILYLGLLLKSVKEVHKICHEKPLSGKI
jgi:hypothetical protein